MCSTLQVTTGSGRVLNFPGCTAIIDADGSVWIGDDETVAAHDAGEDTVWEAYFAPTAVEFTRAVDEG